MVAVVSTSTKRELARELLTSRFAHRDRVAIAEVVTAASEIGVSRRTLSRAAKEIGVREIHNGPYGGFWEKI